jgi:hypothetical protein
MGAKFPIGNMYDPMKEKNDGKPTGKYEFIGPPYRNLNFFIRQIAKIQF